MDKTRLKELLEDFTQCETSMPFTRARNRAVDCALALLEYLEGPEC